MASQHTSGQEKAAQVTRRGSRIATIALAALVVAALALFFLFGNNNAPGPMADASQSYSRATETAKSFTDTQVVQPGQPAPQ